MNYTPEQITANKIMAINELNNFINDITPLYIDFLSKGYKINNGNVFSKKDKERLSEIDKSIERNKTIRHYFDINEYHIIIKFDIHYYVSEFSCNYIHQNIYISNTNMSDPKKMPIRELINFSPLKDNYTTQEYDAAVKEIEGYKYAIDQLNNNIQSVKSAFYPLFD